MPASTFSYRLLAALLCTLSFAVLPLWAGEDYKFGPDSEEQPDVPKGTVKDFKWTESKIYPGTVRNVWIYLPPNFNAETEYRLMIFQDGGGAVGADGRGRVWRPAAQGAGGRRDPFEGTGRLTVLLSSLSATM